MVFDEYQALDKQNNAHTLEFLTQVERKPTFSSMAEKSSFLKLLLKDLQSKREEWNEELKTKALSVIRILGRDQAGSDPLFTKEASQESRYSFNWQACISPQKSLIRYHRKKHLNEEHVVDSCLYVLQSEDHRLSLETQFLTCRILFFLTVHRSDIVLSLIKSNAADAIAKVLCSNIASLEDPAARTTIDQTAPINPLTVTSEALKLLFNLMLVGARSEDAIDTNQAFKECLAPILRLIFHVPFAEPQPLVPPHSQAIHALMQFQYTTIAQVWSEQSEWTRQLYSKEDADDEHGYKYMANTLVSVLDQSIHVLIPSGDPDHDGSQSVDATIAPLLLVLVSLAEGNEASKKAMAKQMLPKEK
ncbi:hypothetical protein G6F42_017426 [Rhizopus arrhizus]|nr:hypothetical protein G6F42_017426 [Rhizopus arrhizus]